MKPKNLEKALHKCSECGDKTATCKMDFDADGASWAWVTWTHKCSNQNCRYTETKEIQHPYNFEQVDFCEICNQKYEG